MGNLILNPGFEDGITPWTTFSDGNLMPGLAASTAQAHSGLYSGWVSRRTQSFEGTVQDIRQSAVQGQSYDVSAWAMVGYPVDEAGADAAFAATEPVMLVAAVTCLADGSDVVSYQSLGSATGNDKTWAQVTGLLVVPSCDLISLEIYLSGPEPGVDLFVDDVSVTSH